MFDPSHRFSRESREQRVIAGPGQEQLQMWLLQEARFAALLVGAPATTYLCGWVPKLAI